MYDKNDNCELVLVLLLKRKDIDFVKEFFVNKKEGLDHIIKEPSFKGN